MEVHNNAISRDTARELGAFVFPPGTIIFPKVGGAMLTNKRRITTRSCCIDNNLMGAIVHGAHSEFVKRLLQNIDLAQVTNPGPVPAVNESQVGNIAIYLPPPEEQAAIVRYLDHADDLINRYISAKERLIALLEEQRQAVVNRVVTQGLNSSVKRSDQVPTHWRKGRLKEVASIQQGITIGPHRNEPELIQRPYLRVANVQAGSLDLSEVTITGVSPAEIKRSSLQVGDVLMTEGGDIDKLGRGCIWQGEIPDCLHQNHVFSVRPDPDLLNPRFLVALMGSSYGRDYFFVTAKQTTNLAATNRNTLGNFPMYLPTAVEQQTIVNELDQRSAAANGVIAQTRRQIDVINEYRTRLIADVVTGQLDVRDAAVELQS